MKKDFKDPEISVIRIDDNCIICTSGLGCGDNDNETGVDTIYTNVNQGISNNIYGG